MVMMSITACQLKKKCRHEAARGRKVKRKRRNDGDCVNQSLPAAAEEVSPRRCERKEGLGKMQCACASRQTDRQTGALQGGQIDSQLTPTCMQVCACARTHKDTKIYTKYAMSLSLFLSHAHSHTHTTDCTHQATHRPNRRASQSLSKRIC